MRRTVLAAALSVGLAATAVLGLGAAPAQAATMPSSVRAQYDHQYGTFTPFTKSGHTDATIVLPQNARSGIMLATFSPASADAPDFEVAELLSNGTLVDAPVFLSGTYRGRVAYGTDSWRKPAALRVTGTGQWTLRFSPVSSAPALTSSGHGDNVMLYWGATTTRQFTCAANKQTGCMLRETLLRNDYETILAHDDEGRGGSKRVTLTSGPSVLQVNEGGDWSLR